ncbi:hypothetical protein [Alteromonas sp. ASW11-130]|uniref:hypothetical protein n=1 Tax=Alteromonas sp. ASW11-130 TaxID=3015775 RepID=UPI002242489D|nr:hypothetical protein [Alteromonas sp. ASW11-130]MCW8091021.1 hypothetical protein [Alteromonas sp. ASW11-130]
MPQVKSNFNIKVDCKQRWHEMETIDRVKRIKQCNVCQEKIYWCNSVDEIKEAISNGACIAAHNGTLEEAGMYRAPVPDGSAIFVGEAEITSYMVGQTDMTDESYLLDFSDIDLDND